MDIERIQKRIAERWNLPLEEIKAEWSWVDKTLLRQRVEFELAVEDLKAAIKKAFKDMLPKWLRKLVD